MGEVVEFRRKPATPQVNPIMAGAEMYLIGLAVVGLITIAMIDGLMGDDTKRR
jgi:hypothetical protein